MTLEEKATINRTVKEYNGDKKVFKKLLEKNLGLKDENNKLLDVINNQNVKITDLEKQIEKMKCCGNCSKYDRHDRVCSRTKFSVIETLCNCSKDWELKE